MCFLFILLKNRRKIDNNLIIMTKCEFQSFYSENLVNFDRKKIKKPNNSFLKSLNTTKVLQMSFF